MLKDELLTLPGIDMQLVEYGMTVLELTEEEFYYALSIVGKHPQISRYDALALAIAKCRSFVMLTGDRRLRMAAAEEGVEVRGTIWIFDELLQEEVISEENYVGFMKLLIHHNGKEIRLPQEELELRVNKHKKKE